MPLRPHQVTLGQIVRLVVISAGIFYILGPSVKPLTAGFALAIVAVTMFDALRRDWPDQRAYLFFSAVVIITCSYESFARGSGYSLNMALTYLLGVIIMPFRERLGRTARLLLLKVVGLFSETPPEEPSAPIVWRGWDDGASGEKPA